MHSELQWKKDRGEERKKKGKVKACAAANSGAALYQHSQPQSVLLIKSSVQGFLGEGSAVKNKSWVSLSSYSFTHKSNECPLLRHLWAQQPTKNKHMVGLTEWWRNLVWEEAGTAKENPSPPVLLWAAGDLVIAEGLMKDVVCTQLSSQGCISSSDLWWGTNISPAPGLILPTMLRDKPGNVFGRAVPALGVCIHNKPHLWIHYLPHCSPEPVPRSIEIQNGLGWKGP